MTFANIEVICGDNQQGFVVQDGDEVGQTALGAVRSAPLEDGAVSDTTTPKSSKIPSHSSGLGQAIVESFRQGGLFVRFDYQMASTDDGWSTQRMILGAPKVLERREIFAMAAMTSLQRS